MKYGKPMRDVLVDLYAEHGVKATPQSVIAAELGVSQPTLSQWVARAGLKRRVVLVRGWERVG